MLLISLNDTHVIGACKLKKYKYSFKAGMTFKEFCGGDLWVSEGGLFKKNKIIALTWYLLYLHTQI